MKTIPVVFGAVLLPLLCQAAEINTIDAEITRLSQTIAAKAKENGSKKLTVLDFTDLQGNSIGQLGRYLADELTVDLVENRQGFSVLDRANLKSILGEHKLNAKGLIDPDSAKKLGMFTGADSIIIGLLTASNRQSMKVTVKIESTETAEILAATHGEFLPDEPVRNLIAQPSIEQATGGDFKRPLAPPPPPPLLARTNGDLKVEINSAQIVDGLSYSLSLTLRNESKTKSVWVAVERDPSNSFPVLTRSTLLDPNSTPFILQPVNLKGIEVSSLERDGYGRRSIPNSTEIEPRGFQIITMTFTGRQAASAGLCSIDLAFLVGTNMKNGYGQTKAVAIAGNLQIE